MNTPSFESEIAYNSALDVIDEHRISRLGGGVASLGIRERGCFVTDSVLFSPTLQESVAVLYSDPNLETPKLTASHIMSPVGPYKGIGGQHGFPRWADYKEFPLDDGMDGEKRASFQAKRSDSGLAIAKLFELSDSSLHMVSSLHNPEATVANTSIGEHLYFTLAEEQFVGLQLDGLGLDELLGEGAQDTIKSGEPLFLADFSGNTTIVFPEGYSVQLAVDVDGAENEQLGMLVWHRPDTESVCFEPTLGYTPETGGTGLALKPYSTVKLATNLTLL